MLSKSLFTKEGKAGGREGERKGDGKLRFIFLFVNYKVMFFSLISVEHTLALRKGIKSIQTEIYK